MPHLMALIWPLILFYLCSLYQTNCQKVTKDDIAELKDLLLPDDLSEEPATVLVVLLVRNKAHVLPLFLTYFEQLDYPKDRMALWIRSDHNFDQSIDILQLWLNHSASSYHSVNYDFDNTTQHYDNESSPFDWPSLRFHQLIEHKENAFIYARQIWADFIFYLDADVLLTAPETLTQLIRYRLPVVAPMLLSEGLYSNFWCGMTNDYYYKRTDDYRDIYNVNKEGIFHVPMIHSAVLIHLNYKGSQYLTFDGKRLQQQQENNNTWSAELGPQCRFYNGPLDDIIVLAISANCSKIPLFISNELLYGYILQPIENTDSVQQDLKQLVNIKTNIINDLGSVKTIPDYLQPYVSPINKEKLSLDHIYMINLRRRPERRQKMENLFEAIGLDVEYFPAVDGKKLNHDIIQEMGIKFLIGYEDPYHHRQMTMGEIGCFLSHYTIWQQIVEKQQKEVLILEDDIRFEPYFIDTAKKILKQARQVIEYDLIYFGRKRLKDEFEPWVAGTENLVHVGYSYWTLGYVISLKGAKKLLDAQPMQKLLPVDEFLPIMFDRHPNKTWSAAFEQRDLNAYSAAPLLLYPTHYTGDMGYISDTEDSALVKSSDKINYGQAQLKSDRELDFSKEPFIQIASSNLKYYEEL